MTYRLQLLAASAAVAFAADKGDGGAKTVHVDAHTRKAPKDDEPEAPATAPVEVRAVSASSLGLDPAALEAEAAKEPTLEEREAAVRLRRLQLQEEELVTMELELAARRAAALASNAPAAIVSAGPDPAEIARMEARDLRMHEMVADRSLTQCRDTRRAIARDHLDHELEELADVAADLAAHGVSLTAVIRKAAKDAFGIALQ